MRPGEPGSRLRADSSSWPPLPGSVPGSSSATRVRAGPSCTVPGRVLGGVYVSGTGSPWQGHCPWVFLGPASQSLVTGPVGFCGSVARAWSLFLWALGSGSQSVATVHRKRRSGVRRPGYGHCPWGTGVRGSAADIVTPSRGLKGMTTESVASLADFRWDKSEATCWGRLAGD